MNKNVNEATYPNNNSNQPQTYTCPNINHTCTGVGGEGLQISSAHSLANFGGQIWPIKLGGRASKKQAK